MTAPPFSRCRLPLAVVVLAAASGCTSVLSTASLRDLLAASREHAADSAAGRDSPSAGAGDTAFDEAATAERRQAAIDETIARLARLDHLDDDARATLVATLQRTDQEDWPAVVDAFAESLAATVASAATPDPAPELEPPAPAEAAAELETLADDASEIPEPAPRVVAKADLDAAGGPAPATESAPAPEPGPRTMAVAEPPAAEPPPEPSPAPEPAPIAAPALSVRNACFATRVQAWGVVDRFTTDRFAPGQDVIVYFELDGLSASESAAGHTTCIDTTLRLVAADGSLVHEWGFEPIAETCRARRHDYFARYVVRVPAGAAAGRHAVELVVSDTLSGQVAKETLALEIAQPAAP